MKDSGPLFYQHKTGYEERHKCGKSSCVLYGMQASARVFSKLQGFHGIFSGPVRIMRGFITQRKIGAAAIHAV